MSDTNRDPVSNRINQEDNFPPIEYIKPADIEKRSMQIIQAELKEKHIVLPEDEAPTIMRCIHTSADFSYAKTLVFSENAVQTTLDLLRHGADIVTDTNMGRSGINRRILQELGGEVHCFMADPEVAAESKERGVTRAVVSMERAAAIEKPVIFAIGNAPTALLELYRMYREGTFTPAFIIGVPVGFVNVVAAKERILSMPVPYIVNRGRKGGSNIAAAIVNSLLYQIRR